MALVSRGFTVVKPDLLCLEVHDEDRINYDPVQTDPPTGENISNIVTNDAGGFRITVPNASTFATMRSVKGITDNGSGLFRIEVFDASGLSNGQSVMINGVQGATQVNGTWVVSNVNTTTDTFDLNSSTYAAGYTVGGYVATATTNNWGTMVGHNSNIMERFHIRGVAGDLGDQLNAMNWIGALWSSTEIDIVHPFPNNTDFGGTRLFQGIEVFQKEHAYTSGGVCSNYYANETATNPHTEASETCLRYGRDNDWLKFRAPSPTVYENLDRAEADDPANYPTIGGRTVTAVYRASQPWWTVSTEGTAIQSTAFRHRIFIELNGDLPQGVYDLDFSFINLGTLTLDYADKRTRSYSILSTPIGFRPGDTYKKAFIRAWVPGYGNEDGSVDFSSYIGADTGHIIDVDGTIVDSFNITLRRDNYEVEAGQTGWNTIANTAQTAITGAVNNGAGLIRISVASDADNARYQTGVRLFIFGVGGVPNASGEWVITRISNTQFDLQGSTFAGTYTSGGTINSNFPYSSTTRTIPIEDIDHTVVPVRITSTAHGLTTGDAVRPHNIGRATTVGARGPSAANATTSAMEKATWVVFNTVANATVSYYLVVVVDPDTIELTSPSGVDVDLTACTVSYTPGTGGDLHLINYNNAAGCAVYECDFSAFTTEGRYRFYVEGLGVSNEFRIDEAVWADYGQFHAMGEYNQRLCLRNDGRFGTSYPHGTHLDGDGTTKVYRSRLPTSFTTQGYGPVYSGITSTAYISAGAFTYPPWHTWERATELVGGHMDAADSDDYGVQHIQLAMKWASMCSLVPSAATVDWRAPSLSSRLGGIWDSSTDDIKGLLNAAIWQVHWYLAAADEDGMTHGGQAGSYTQRQEDLGPQTMDRSCTVGYRIGLFAGDHLTNYQVACCAAIISRCLTALGHTTQAAWYAERAELLYAWAETLFWDYPGDGGAWDDYYADYCYLNEDTTGLPNWQDVIDVQNNGSGLFRVTMDSPATTLVAGYRVFLRNIGGCPAANGGWTITNVSGDSFDLVGSTYSGTYTSGGEGAAPQDVRWGLASIHLSMNSGCAGTLSPGGVSGANLGYRAAAAAALFRLTGDAAYDADFVESYPASVNIRNWVGLAWWEMYSAPSKSVAAQAVLDAARNQWTNQYREAYGYNYGYHSDGTTPTQRPALDHMPGRGSVTNGGFAGISTGAQEQVWCLAHYRQLIFDETDNWIDEPADMIAGGMHYLYGMNAAGYSTISGLGDLYIRNHLHLDRRAYGDGQIPKGIPVYWATLFGVVYSVSANFDCGPLNQTVLVPDTITYADDLNKTIEPPHFAWPVHDCVYTAPQMVSVMEYTIGGPIEMGLLAAGYMHGWDGNTEGPTPPRLSVQVTAA
jgi:hypothetical protein